MDQKNHTVTLYALQADPVIEAIYTDGVCFSKREYVKKKYQESAPVFLAAYDFYVSEAIKYVPKPDGAESVQAGLWQIKKEWIISNQKNIQ